MNKREARLLVSKYNKGKASEAEKASLNDWYARESLRQMQNPEIEDYVRIKTEVWTAIAAGSKPQTKLWPWLSAAVSLFIVISLGLYFWPEQDIPAGINTATLTLANGKTIQLNSAKSGVVIDASKLTYSDGTAILSPKDTSTIGGRLNTKYSLLNTIKITTPRGGQYQVKLPDGTSIFMNAASSITFPLTFAGLKERRVQMSGEAYFKVRHNKNQPFLVTTQGQIVEDLGTEFNINAYADEPAIKTTLVEGSAIVRLAINGSKVSTQYPPLEGAGGGRTREVTLKPGQESTLNDNMIKVNTVDPLEATAWQQGYFVFNEENLGSIMRKVSRWYNVKITYKDPEVSKQTFSGTMSRFKTVSKILSKIELTKAARFSVQGNTITVMKY